jgi:osmotically-inducible protein OsmY
MIRTRHLPLLLAPLLLGGCAAAVIGGAAVTTKTLHDRRPVSVVIDDQRITARSYTRINRDEALGRGQHIRVISHNGIVLLIGEVQSGALRERVEQVVSDVPDVRDVVNELSVQPPVGVRQRMRNVSITARVKTALLDLIAMPGFDPTRVNVSTARDIVYLQGLVTREEADAVVGVARNMAGVREVVTVFEYIEPPSTEVED